MGKAHQVKLEVRFMSLVGKFRVVRKIVEDREDPDEIRFTAARTGANPSI